MIDNLDDTELVEITLSLLILNIKAKTLHTPTFSFCSENIIKGMSSAEDYL